MWPPFSVWVRMAISKARWGALKYESDVRVRSRTSNIGVFWWQILTKKGVFRWQIHLKTGSFGDTPKKSGLSVIRWKIWIFQWHAKLKNRLLFVIFNDLMMICYRFYCNWGSLGDNSEKWGSLGDKMGGLWVTNGQNRGSLGDKW